MSLPIRASGWLGFAVTSNPGFAETSQLLKDWLALTGWTGAWLAIGAACGGTADGAMTVAACEAGAFVAPLLVVELFVHHHAPAAAIASVVAVAANMELEVFFAEGEATDAGLATFDGYVVGSDGLAEMLRAG